MRGVVSLFYGVKRRTFRGSVRSTKDRPKGEGKWKNTQSSNAFWDRRVGEGKEGGESKKAKCEGRRGRRSVTCGIPYHTENTPKWGPLSVYFHLADTEIGEMVTLMTRT